MAITDLRVEEQDLSAGDLELEARDDESLEIVARGVSGADADTTIEEYVREELMTAYPADQGDENLLQESTVQRMHMDFFGYLRDMGLSAPMIAVPEGQAFTLSSTTDSGQATVLYRELQPNSVGRSQPGGPGTKERTFVSTGRETIDLSTVGTPAIAELDTSVQPAQLDEFPWNDNVPPNREYDLQAVMLSLSADSTDGDPSLDSFKLTSDETDFMARDSSFISTELARYPNSTLTTIPMLFEDEPTFSPGADLDVTVNLSGAGDGTAIIDASLVFYRRDV